MQAITTKYHGPTDYRGARLTASTESGLRITVPYDHAHEGTLESHHATAAIALARKMGWHGTLYAGGVKGGYVFVWESQWERYEVRP